VVQSLPSTEAKRFSDPSEAGLHAFPKIFRDDPRFRLLNYTPLAFWAVATQSLVAARLLHEPGPIPHYSADVEIAA
jgi:hypothetical protein